LEEYETGGACGPYGGKRNAYRVLMGKPGGKRRLERPRYNFETGLKARGWKHVDWIDLADDREERCTVVHAVMNLRLT
jgi:hypothetical protein